MDVLEAAGDDVAGHGEEARGEDRLGEQAVLHLVQANRLVVPPPVPARDVQQVRLKEAGVSLALPSLPTLFWYCSSCITTLVLSQ